MLPAIYDLAIYQGDTWERTIDLADSEGTPVPLDDWTIRAQIREAGWQVALVTTTRDLAVLLVLALLALAWQTHQRRAEGVWAAGADDPETEALP